MMLPMAIHPDTVALAYDADGNIFDEPGNWQTAENIAMHDFDCVDMIAIDGDGWYDTTESLQAMINRALRDRRDCFGA